MYTSKKSLSVKNSTLKSLRKKAVEMNLKTPVPSVLTMENIGFLFELKAEMIAAEKANADPNKMTRTAFDKLPLRSRADFIHAGGRVYDAVK